jgi:hypothetical protein
VARMGGLSANVPLFSFGFHPYPNWLKEIAEIAKEEPWGKNFKVLELYLRANFEIAKAQGKVYEDREKNAAFWRAGHLVNVTSDPLWLVYQRNSRDEPYWQLRRVATGEAPEGRDSSHFTLKYDPPEFNQAWLIHFQQWNIDHIMGDSRNKKRLQDVFKNALGGHFNEHLIFRALYGEIQLKRKEEVVLPQWYRGDYQFLMPLFLTQQKKVELTAVLLPEPPMKRYVVKTLLLPYYAYAYARAVVRSRASFADWMMLSEEDLSKAAPEEDEEEES